MFSHPRAGNPISPGARGRGVGAGGGAGSLGAEGDGAEGARRERWGLYGPLKCALVIFSVMVKVGQVYIYIYIVSLEMIVTDSSNVAMRSNDHSCSN